MLEDIDVDFVSNEGDILAPGLKAKENNGGYPASTMFGSLSSWGLFIRHAENVKLRKVKLANKALDPQRMEYSEDVKGLVHD